MTLENVTLVLPDGVFAHSALRIQSETIAEIEKGRKLSELPTGFVVIPGLVDLHGDMLEREIEPRPTSRFPVDIALHELDKRHAASGITTAYVALSFSDFAERDDDLRLNSRMKEMVEQIVAERSHLSCDTRIHARFEIMNPEATPLLGEMIQKKKVEMISLMDHTPGQGQFRDLEGYVTYMMKWLKVGREAAQKELERQLAQPRSWDIVDGLTKLAKEHCLPIASHDDDTPDKVALMAELGVTISEFPVTLGAAQAAKAKNMFTLMGAPNALRGRSHSGNLSATEALQANTLDSLASDYYPATMLHAAFALAERGVIPLHEAIRLVSLHPAHAAGLIDRGSLAVGKKADFVIVQCQANAKVIATVRKGRVIYWSGHSLPILSDVLTENPEKQRIPLLAFIK